jgi:hypothetical protein
VWKWQWTALKRDDFAMVSAEVWGGPKMGWFWDGQIPEE